MFPLTAKADILQWLHVDDGRQRVSSPLRGTFDWITENQSFTSWIENSSSVLWLTGKPGSGKSTLMRHISEEPIAHALGMPLGAITASHFLGHSRSSREASISLARSLLYQFCFQSLQVESQQNSRGWQYSKPYLDLQLRAEKEEELSYHDLVDLLQAFVIQVSQDHAIYIMVDALDECDDEAGKRILSLLSTLRSITAEKPVQICLSSRSTLPLEPISRSQLRTIYLENETSKDLEYFARMEIQRMMPLAPKDSHLASAIVDHAEGMFLWAKLAICTLTDRYVGSEPLEILIGSLPEGLFSLYDRLLQNLATRRKIPALFLKRTLMWLSFSRRPLSLEELSEALVFDPVFDLPPEKDPLHSPFDAATIGPNVNLAPSTSELISRLINTEPTENHVLCVDGLLDATGISVTLIHQSARDFLVANNRELSSSEGFSKTLPHVDAHISLAISCLRYLTLNSRNQRDLACPTGPMSVFKPYAEFYWPYHAKYLDTTLTLDAENTWALNSPSNDLHALQIKRTVSLVKGTQVFGQDGRDFFRICAAFGLYRFTYAMLQSHESTLERLDIGGPHGRTALSLAAEHGHSSIVRLLLDYGADMSKRDTRYGLAALHWACSSGSAYLCKLLIDAGAHVNDEVAASPPLIIAAAKNRHKIVRVLLSHGADANIIERNSGRTPLHYAAARGNAQSVLDLLSHGANLNVKDQQLKRTPLDFAIASGNLEIIRSLLDRGRDSVDLSSHRVDSPSGDWLGRITLDLSRSYNDRQNSRRAKLGPGGALSQCASGNGDCTSQRTEYDCTTKADTPSAQEVRSPKKGKRSHDESDDTPNRRPKRRNDSPSSSAVSSARLACPFYKNCPVRYSENKTCRGPQGWPDVHRVKYVVKDLEISALVTLADFI